MTAENDMAAVIPAAGYSSRLPDFKPLLPLGESTVIETTIDIFRRAGITNIHVVLGHRADEVRPLVLRSGAQCVINTNFDEGMFSSVVAGLRSLAPEVKAAFILPGDMPLVKSSTVKELVKAYRESEAHILYPVFMNRRGHPPLIPAELFADIISWRGGGGLRTLLSQYDKQSTCIEVQDEGILMDIDTEQDYINIVPG